MATGSENIRQAEQHEQPLEGARPLESKPDSAANLRNQYFDCLASGKSSCEVPTKPREPNGSIELTNPYTSIIGNQSERAEALVEQPKPITADTVLPRAQWTLAFNLTTTQDHQSASDSNTEGARVYAGARNKTAELLELAATTVGKPVTLVVQNAQKPESSEASPAAASSNNQVTDGQARASLSASGKNSGASGMLIHTYLIHDGQIQELPTRPSQGVAADTEALLNIAGRQAPSEHLALFAQGHGGGPHGVSGDTGRASLEEMDAAIKNGLASSGRDRLDLVDFDACSMGNAAVLAAVSSRADNIIASPEMETAGGEDIDAQNVRAIVGAVLSNPAMNGHELGQKIIDLAAQGANGGAAAPREIDRTVAGTDTLSHYNAAEIGQFNQHLDNLGAALTQAFESESNRQAILTAIGEAPLASQAGGVRISGTPRAELRDSKTFAINIINAIENGSLSDPQGQIRSATEALQASQSRLVAGYHGEKAGGYDQQGGLSIFLPGRTYLDNQARADELNPAHDLTSLASNERFSNLENKESLLNRLGYNIEDVQEAQTKMGGDLRALEPISQAREALRNANTQAEYTTALGLLGERARQFQQSEAGQRLNQIYLEQARAATTKAFAEEIPAQSQGQWTTFLRNLQALAR
ncbi:MAG: hypothetical protein QG574_3846 [Cyanobacteriota bacterium erpe_2018_sw_21hr_WHONDRS-SW48-000092_B_bin.40]|nr:hypothetical protein [Cyanobacteriota bacterium erpe_2018_sw_21hr_WHONDRS-SW48-000092_B_bin.40]